MRLLSSRPSVTVWVLAILCVAGVVVPRAAVATAVAHQDAPAGQATLPNKPDSLKFAIIGDNGTGDKPQYEIGELMNTWHAKFDFPIVVMMGDNIYGSDRPQDFIKKFE